MTVFRVVGAATAVAALLASSPASAQGPVPVCDALSLYANGARTGLCRSLSPTIQNLWVCELTGDATDVHATFNAGVALHITVRVNPGAPTCQGNSILTGTYPGAPGNLLRRAVGQPALVCGVQIDNYVQRLIAVPQLPPAPGQNRVQTAMLNAMAGGRVTPALAQTYINTAAAQPAPGC
jgi:hypothetical protein